MEEHSEDKNEEDQPLAPPRRKSFKVKKGGSNVESLTRKSVRPVAIMKPKVPIKPKVVKTIDDIDIHGDTKVKKNPPRPPPPIKSRSVESRKNNISSEHTSEINVSTPEKSVSLKVNHQQDDEKLVIKPKPAPRPKIKPPTPVPRQPSLNKEKDSRSLTRSVATDEIFQDEIFSDNFSVQEQNPSDLSKRQSLTHPSTNKKFEIRSLSQPLDSINTNKKKKYERSLSHEDLFASDTKTISARRVRSRSVDGGLNEETKTTRTSQRYENVDNGFSPSSQHSKSDMIKNRKKQKHLSKSNSYENVKIPANNYDSTYSMSPNNQRRPSLPDFIESLENCVISAPLKESNSVYSWDTSGNPERLTALLQDDTNSCPSSPVVQHHKPKMPCLEIRQNEVETVSQSELKDEFVEDTYSVPPPKCAQVENIYTSPKLPEPQESDNSDVPTSKYTSKSPSKKSGIYYNVTLECSRNVDKNDRHESKVPNKGCSTDFSIETVTEPASDTSYVEMSSSTEVHNIYEQVPSKGNRDSAYEEISFEGKKGNELKLDRPPRPPSPGNRSIGKPTSDSNDYSTVDSLTGGEHIQKSDEMSCSESESDEYEVDGEDVKNAVQRSGDKLYHIATEILTTERSFVHSLMLICEEFATPLKAAIAKNTKLLPDGYYGEIFLNIEQIYELDKKFLQELEDRMQNWDLHMRIGDLIREYGHFLKMYTTYIKGYDNAMAIFHECAANNMKFMQIVAEFEKNKQAKRMKLCSYFLKPIQRIPSYRLLLIDYLKHLPKDSVDYKDLTYGVEIVSKVADHINECMKEGEKLQEVLRIQSQIVNANNVVKPGRFFLKEGTLQKLSRKELQNRTFILFTDVLLYCSSFGQNRLKLIMELPLAGMIVLQPDSQDLTNEFTIISTRRSFLVNASSPKEREEWVAALRNAIDIVNKKLETFCSMKDSKQNSDSDLGIKAPPWVPDGRVTMCQICTLAFKLHNRRHHCRACGKVVCSTCSSFEAPLRYMDNGAGRVCEICHTYLFEKFLETKSSGDADDDALKDIESKFKKRNKRQIKKPTVSDILLVPTEGIETSGFLHFKKGKKEKEKLRWFVFKGHVLYMYKASYDPAASSTTPVLGYRVDVGENWNDEDFVFHLTHPGVKEALTFRAENRTAAERWLHCLCKATTWTPS